MFFFLFFITVLLLFSIPVIQNKPAPLAAYASELQVKLFRRRLNERYRLSLPLTMQNVHSHGSAVKPILSRGLKEKKTKENSIIFLHPWLPKSHIGAPATARILLAYLLLKLFTAGYLQM